MLNYFYYYFYNHHHLLLNYYNIQVTTTTYSATTTTTLLLLLLLLLPVNIILQAIRQFSNRIKAAFRALCDALNEIKAAIVRSFSWIKSIAEECNKIMGVPYRRCTRAFDDAISKCFDHLPPVVEAMCHVVTLVKQVRVNLIVCVSVCLCVCMCVCLFLCVCAQYAYPYVHTYTHTYSHAHLHAHTYIYTCVHTYNQTSIHT